LIASVVVALGALVILNGVMQRMDPKFQEQQAEEAAQKKQEEQQKQPPSASGPSSPGGAKLVELGDDAVVGNKKGTTEIVVAYQWTPDVQADPSKVYNVIEMLPKATPQAHLRVVNADAHPGTPLGVSMNGKVVLPAQLDGSIPANPMMMQSIMRMTGGPGGYGGYGPGKMAPPGP